MQASQRPAKGLQIGITMLQLLCIYINVFVLSGSECLQAGVKVAGKAVAECGRAAGAAEAQTEGAAVVDGRRAIGVLEREHRQGFGQGREAMELDHVGCLKVLQIIVHLALTPSA